MLKTEYIKVIPPAGIVQPCHYPLYAGTTNGELLEWSSATISHLIQCSLDNLRAYEALRDGSGNTGTDTL